MVEDSQGDEQGGPATEESVLPQSPLVKKGYLVAGKYELEYQIGHGGMGSVWAARHVKLGQRAAVKFVSTSHIDSEDALQRFDREAKAAATIRSRNVVQVYDNGELEDGTPYMIMEYLEGESLHTHIEREGSIALEEAVRIVRQVGRALSVAHGMHIIHRDIKPENVFLATLPGDEVYTGKVLDFGVAKFMQARGQGQARTRTGTIVGTPLYMSPEQVRGLKTIDHRTDVYSLGALTFTMLTGTLVFNGKTFGDLLFQICTEPLPKVTEAAPWLPTAVDDWFEKSCARAPEDRFQTVQEQVEALSAAVGVSVRATMPETKSSPPPPPSAETSPAPPTASSPGTEQPTSLPRADSSAGGRQRVSVVAPTMMAFADIDDVPDTMEPAPATPKVPSAPQPASAAAVATAAKPPNLVAIVVVGFVLLIVIAFGAFYLGGRYAAQPQPPAPSQPAP